MVTDVTRITLTMVLTITMSSVIMVLTITMSRSAVSLQFDLRALYTHHSMTSMWPRAEKWLTLLGEKFSLRIDVFHRRP